TRTKFGKIINMNGNLPDGHPFTFRETTPPTSLPTFGALDPQDTLIGNYVFTTTPTVLSNTALTASKPWRVLFIGLWVNNFEGAALAQPGLFMEATTASPSFSIGSVTVTVSTNGSNQLQVATGANVAGFSGRIIITSNNNGAAGTSSGVFKGSI